MAIFEDECPSRENYWQSIILFGRNLACYKFALALMGALLLVTVMSGCESPEPGPQEPTIADTIHDTVCTAEQKQNSIVLPRDYDGIALGMNLHQIRDVFPDMIEEPLDVVNGPASQQYRGSERCKTFVADQGQSGFVMLDGCLVSFYTTKGDKYAALMHKWETRFGPPCKRQKLENGAMSSTWKDQFTENTIQDGLSFGFWLDALDFDELASDFEKHNAVLVSPSKERHQWEIYDCAEYVPGYKSPDVRNAFLALQSPEGAAAQNHFWVSQEVLRLTPGTKLRKLGIDGDTRLVKARILSGSFKGHIVWVEGAAIERVH